MKSSYTNVVLRNTMHQKRTEQSTKPKLWCVQKISIRILCGSPKCCYFPQIYLSWLNSLPKSSLRDYLSFHHTLILLIICCVSIDLDWSWSITSSTTMSATSLFVHWRIALPWIESDKSETIQYFYGSIYGSTLVVFNLATVLLCIAFL